MEKSIANSELIKKGSSKKEVMNALGSPYSISTQKPNIWYYNSLAWISFDINDRVNEWHDHGNILTPKFESND